MAKGDVLLNRKTEGFKCLKCFSSIYVDYFHYSRYNGWTPTPDSGDVRTSDMCLCNNCGLILDTQGIVHLYCDDIRTVVLVSLNIINGECTEVQVQQTHNSFRFVDYKPIGSTPWNFVDFSTEAPKSRTKAFKAFKRRNKRINNG